MASKTQVTERKRKAIKRNMGQPRKRLLRKNGSTPSKAKLFGDE